MHTVGMSDRREPTAPEKAAGQILKAIRTEKGLAPTLVAYRLGMGERNLLRYESGVNQLNVLQIGDFARALEEDPRDLFERLYPLLKREHDATGRVMTAGRRSFSLGRAAAQLSRALVGSSARVSFVA